LKASTAWSNSAAASDVVPDSRLPCASVIILGYSSIGMKSIRADGRLTRCCGSAASGRLGC
jgi:hypothetical protein